MSKQTYKSTGDESSTTAETKLPERAPVGKFVLDKLKNASNVISNAIAEEKRAKAKARAQAREEEYQRLARETEKRNCCGCC